MKKLSKLIITTGLAVGLAFSMSLANSTFAADGAALYKKNCKKCHGDQGQGKKSKKDPSKFRYEPVNHLTSDELVKSLNDYRAALASGKELDKSVKKMAKAAAKLDDAGVVSVSDFIDGLK